MVWLQVDMAELPAGFKLTYLTYIQSQALVGGVEDRPYACQIFVNGEVAGIVWSIKTGNLSC